MQGVEIEVDADQDDLMSLIRGLRGTGDRTVQAIDNAARSADSASQRIEAIMASADLAFAESQVCARECADMVSKSVATGAGIVVGGASGFFLGRAAAFLTKMAFGAAGVDIGPLAESVLRESFSAVGTIGGAAAGGHMAASLIEQSHRPRE